MTTGKRVLVTRAGGFIGHHLVGYLKDRGYFVRGVDICAPAYEESRADEFHLLDLRQKDILGNKTDMHLTRPASNTD